MSLVEATIILAVVGILAAISAPSVRSYVRDAQDTRAVKDTATIGAALERMLTDVGETAFLRDGNGASATDPPSHVSTNVVDMLVSDGNTPLLSVSRATPNGNGTDWASAVNNAAVQKLSYYLVTNTPSNTTSNAYRTATNMTSQFDPSSGGTFNAPYAWRGAYLATIPADPWGYRYAVNVEFLAHPLGTGPSGNVNDVYVVSAGNNGVVDTRYDVDGVTSSSDDIIFVVSGSTR